MRYELTDYEWGVIGPMLPNQLGGVPRVDDRHGLNGIFWVLRPGPPWCDPPKRFGPYTICYNRFVRRQFDERRCDAASHQHQRPTRAAISTPLPAVPALPAVSAYISHAGSTVPGPGRAG